MTDNLTAEVLRLDAEAAEEPWEASTHDDNRSMVDIPDVGDDVMQLAWHEGFGITMMSPANAELIAHYRTAAPVLARRIEKALATDFIPPGIAVILRGEHDD